MGEGYYHDCRRAIDESSRTETDVIGFSSEIIYLLFYAGAPTDLPLFLTLTMVRGCGYFTYSEI
jgi:hypothetical protein